MAWLSSTPTAIVTSKQTRKVLKSTVFVSGTRYRLFETETVLNEEYRGMTYSVANTLATKAENNVDNITYTNWVTGSITHIDAIANGTKKSTSMSMSNASGGYTVVVTTLTIVSSTS